MLQRVQEKEVHAMIEESKEEAAAQAASDQPAGQFNDSDEALKNLRRALAIELAPRDILVNAIAPGFVDTPMSVVDGQNEVFGHIRWALGNWAMALRAAQSSWLKAQSSFCAPF